MKFLKKYGWFLFCLFFLVWDIVLLVMKPTLLNLFLVVIMLSASSFWIFLFKKELKLLVVHALDMFDVYVLNHRFQKFCLFVEKIWSNDLECNCWYCSKARSEEENDKTNN